MVGPLIKMLVSRIDLCWLREEIAATASKHSVEHFRFRYTSLAEVLGGLALSGKRIFNTAMTVRKADGNKETGAEKVRLEEIGMGGPHEVRELRNQASEPISLTQDSLVWLSRPGRVGIKPR